MFINFIFGGTACATPTAGAAGMSAPSIAATGPILIFNPVAGLIRESLKEGITRTAQLIQPGIQKTMVVRVTGPTPTIRTSDEGSIGCFRRPKAGQTLKPDARGEPRRTEIGNHNISHPGAVRFGLREEAELDDTHSIGEALGRTILGRGDRDIIPIEREGFIRMEPSQPQNKMSNSGGRHVMTAATVVAAAHCASNHWTIHRI
jgi:hypothetical protein